MTEFPARHFTADADVIHVGEGLLACTLPRDEWTHEAHLAATIYLLTADRTSTSTPSCPVSSAATMKASAA